MSELPTADDNPDKTNVRFNLNLLRIYGKQNIIRSMTPVHNYERLINRAIERMPEISRFFGIIIRMYFDDHAPPHFHAIYGGDEAQVGIQPISVLRGELTRRAESMVIEWAALHQQELLHNWKRLQADQPALRIKPLE